MPADSLLTNFNFAVQIELSGLGGDEGQKVLLDRYAQVLAAEFAHLAPVAARLGYPEA